MKKVILTLFFWLIVLTPAHASNYALDFGEFEDFKFVEVGKDPRFDTDEITIEAWIKPTSLPTGHYIDGGRSTIIWNGDQSGGHDPYIFYINEYGALEAHVDFISGPPGIFIIDDTPVSLHEWHHVALVISPSKIELYLDGTRTTKVSHDRGPPDKDNSHVAIGRHRLGVPRNNPFGGLMDEIRIWGVARTRQQINDHMYSVLTGDEGGLVAFWRFNEGSGQVVYDSTSNQINGALGSGFEVDDYDPTWVISDRSMQPPPLTQNLIGYWKFDGNGLDSSGNGRDLDLFGGVGFATGLFGQALDLHGDTNQYAQRPADEAIYDFGSGDFTIQVWVKLNRIDVEQILIEKLTGASGPGWSLTWYDRHDQYDINWHFYALPALRIYTVEEELDLEKYHHIIVRKSGMDIDLFCDNIIQPWDLTFSYVNDPEIPDTINPLLVGKRNAADSRGFPLDGKIDEIAIWNRTLTNDEIDSLWNGGSGTEIPPVPTAEVSGYIEVGGTPLEGATVTIKQHQKPQTTETINGHFQLESVDTARGCTITIEVPETQ
jgi:hypothetical protein